jgi:outer membrane protein assembly factor BamB
MKVKHRRLLLLLSLLIVGVIALSGCTQSVGVARGWAGATVEDSTLFFGTMSGRIVALDISNGNLDPIGVPVKVEMDRSGAGLTCVPTTCAGPRTTAVPFYGSPVITGKEDEKLVFIGGYDSKVRALLFEGNSLRSEPRWISRSDDISGSIVGGLTVVGNTVYFGTSAGMVYALDTVDGHKMNVEFQAGDKIWSTPVIDGDTLYIGCFDGNLYALNTADLSEKWHFETGGAIIATAVVYENKVFIGSFDRHVYAVDVATGNQLWKFPANDDAEDRPGSWFWARPLVQDGVLYAPCIDGRVYALNTSTGEKVMDFDLGNRVSSSPVLVGNLVVIATQNGTIYTLDTATNRLHQLATLEQNEKVYAPLVASEGIVYIHTTRDNLYALGAESGSRRKFNLSGE